MEPSATPPRRCLPHAGALCLLLLSLCWQASAQTHWIGPLDGTFETDLTAGDASGQVAVVAAAGTLVPAQGTKALLLDTRPDAGSLPGDAGQASLTVAGIALPADAPILRFRLNFLTDEPVASRAEDTATISVIDETTGTETTLASLDAWSGLVPLPWNQWRQQTGFRTFTADLSALIPDGHTFTLRIAVADDADGRADSALAVDDLQFAPAGLPIARVEPPAARIDTLAALFLSGTASTPGTAPLVSWQWDFGDGTFGTGPTAQHTYLTEGLFVGTLTITDADGRTDAAPFSVWVGDANRPPEIVSTALRRIDPGADYAYQTLAEDPDLPYGDILTFSLVEGPADMAIDPATGLLSWSPPGDVAIENPVIIQVADSGGLTATQSFVLRIEELLPFVAAIGNVNNQTLIVPHGPAGWQAHQIVGTFAKVNSALAIADVNHDGYPDLVLGGNEDDCTLWALLNDGANGFAPPETLATIPGGYPPTYLTTADLNGDGRDDLVVGTSRANTVYLAMTTGTGYAVTTTSAFADGGTNTANGIDAADLDGDGWPDIVLAVYRKGIYAALNDGAGGLQAAALVDAYRDTYERVTAADFNNDGALDLLVGHRSFTTARFLAGNGDGTFAAPIDQAFTHDIGYNADIDNGDFDGDGNQDLLCSRLYDGIRALLCYPGNGDGTFAAGVELVSSTSSIGWSATAAPPAPFPAAWPVARISPASAAVSLGEQIPFDGTGSAAAPGSAIVHYAWEFSDGTTAEGGSAPHAFPAQEGVHLARLAVTDDAGRTARTGAYVYQRGAPPVASAGGPYVRGEPDADHGTYTVQLDASGSSDDGPADALTYLWDLGGGFHEPFAASVLDPSRWRQAGTILTDGNAILTGAGNWTDVFLRAHRAVGRTPGAAIDLRLRLDRVVADQRIQVAFGFYDPVSDAYLTEFRLDTTNDLNRLLRIREAGLDDRSVSNTLYADRDYDLRFVFREQGFALWWKEVGAANWILLAESTYGNWQTATLMFSANAGALHLDSVSLPNQTCAGANPVMTYPGPGSHAVGLTVTDAFGQSDTDAATITLEAGTPPVADAGGPYTFGEEAATQGVWNVAFDGTGSTDDHEIAEYLWDFGDGKTAQGVSPQYAYTVPGTYQIRLTVSDHARQSHTDTTTVTIAVNDPPEARPGGPYVFDEAYAYRGQWTVQLDGTASADDRGIWDYQWSFPEYDVLRFAGDGTGAVRFPDHASQRTGSVTIMMRLRLAEIASDDMIVGKYTDTPGKGYSFCTPWSDANRFYFFIGSTLSNAASAQIPVGQWTDIVLTAGPSGTTRNILIDGRLAATQYSLNIEPSPSELILGNQYDGQGQMAGEIDFLAVWDRQLSQAEIRERMANGIPHDDPGLAGLWNFANGSLADEGPYGLHGRIVGTGVEPVSLAGPTPELVFGGAVTQKAILTVTDHAGQQHAEQTTIQTRANDLPIPDAGPAQTVEVGMPVILDASASTDDFGIWKWHWNADDSPMPWRISQDPAPLLPEGVLIGEDLVIAARDAVLFPTGDTVEFRVQRGSGSVTTCFGLAETDAPANAPDDYGFALYLRGDELSYVENGISRYSTYRVDVGSLSILDLRITRTATGARFEYRGLGQNDWTLLRDSTFNPPADLLFHIAVTSVSASVTAQFPLVREIRHNGTGLPLPRNDVPLEETASLEYRYRQPGVYTPQVTVTDHAGQQASAQTTVTVVLGQPPVAHAGGPYQTSEITPTRLDAAKSTDDYGIEWYCWDFGDGESAITGDPWIHHAYDDAGDYTLTLTVVDFAGQADTITVPVAVDAGPHLATVPWAFRRGIEIPHDLVSGRETTLKAVAWSKRLPLAYTWDFGDGSAPLEGLAETAAAINAIEAKHTYVGAEGKPFIATVTVEDADGNRKTARYIMRIRAPIIEVDANLALDEGMWYLHKEMIRDSIAKGAWGNWTVPIGDYANTEPGFTGTGGCKTSFGGQVFLVNGHLPSGDPRRDPYVDNAWRTMLSTTTRLEAITLDRQVFGEPDTNGNGIGVDGKSISTGYEFGPLMDFLIALNAPDAHAPIGATGIGHRRWRSVVHDMADTVFWGQTDTSTEEGGAWRYSWNSQDQDNSAAQWPVLGLWPAERIFGIRPPDWVRSRLRRWLEYSSERGHFGYLASATKFDPRVGPSAMMQLSFAQATGIDDPATPADERDTIWARNEDHVAANWDSTAVWYAPGAYKGPYTTYGYLGFFKAMRTAYPEPIVNLRATGLDWFWDDTRGMVRRIVTHQQPDGGWGPDKDGPGTVWGSGVSDHINAAWNLLMLSPTLFQQGPVADAGPSRAWDVGEQVPPLVLDGSRSYHLDPFQFIWTYEWDVDGDGIYETSSDHPAISVQFLEGGMLVNGSIPASAGRTFPEVGMPYEVRPVLRVRDSNEPEVTARSSTIVTLGRGPHAPVAVIADGLVSEIPACVGAPLTLDGSRSFDLDPGDSITAWEWDLDGDGVFDDASGPAPLATFAAPGLYVVALRVSDNGIGNGGVPLTGETYAMVNASHNTAPVLDPSGDLTISAVTEDDDDPPGNTVAEILASDPAVPTPFFDADGDPEGIAVEGATAPHGGVWEYRLEPTQTWLALPAVSPNAALLLPAAASLRFRPDLDYNNGGYEATLDFRAWDGRSGYPGQTNADSTAMTGGGSAFSADDDTLRCPVLDVNDAPVLAPAAVLSFASIAGDDLDPAGQSLASMLASDPAVPQPFSDPDLGHDSGLALVGSSGQAQGQWQYRLAGAPTWTALPGDLADTGALLLPFDALVRFVPSTTILVSFAPTLTFRAWDRTFGTPDSRADASANGGTAAFGAQLQGAPLPVEAANSAPALTGNIALTAITEDDAAPPGDTVAPLLATVSSDNDGHAVGMAVIAAEGDGTWQVNLGARGFADLPADLADNLAFLVPPNATIRFLPRLERNNGQNAHLDFRAWDQTTGTAGQRANASQNGGTTAYSADTAQATIEVTGVNDPPTIDQAPGPVTVTMDEDGVPTPWTAPHLSATDPDTGDVLVWSVDDPQGWASVSGSGVSPTTFAFVPSPNWNGLHVFTVCVADAGQSVAEVAVRVTVRPVNDPPTATPQGVTTLEDTAIEITLAGDDIDGDALSFSVATQPQHGTLAGDVPNLTYTPNQNWHGTDVFLFAANDGTVASQPAAIAITVISTNDPPVATPQDLTTTEDTPLVLVLAGADVDGDGLTFTVATQPQHGTLSGTAPSLTYTPTQEWSGTDTFAFTANDGTVESQPATVSITVTPVNDPPTATPQELTTPEDTPVDIVLAGTDVDGDGLSFAVVDSPTHGTLAGTAQSPTYTPKPNWHGTDSFTFTANDGTIESQPATVTITVTPVNDPPVATPQELTTPEDTPVGIVLAGEDVDGDTLTFAVVDSPTHGTLTGTAQSPTYTPNPNWHGTDAFTFTANDGTVESQPATVSITVTPVNDPPVATPQELTTPEDTPLDIVLAGTDVDVDPLTFTVATQPQNGTLAGTAQSPTYTPNPNWHGTDSFTFSVNDGTVESQPATVSITVTPVNDPPVATPQELTTPEDTPLDIVLAGTDVDVDPLTFTVATQPQNGTLAGTAQSPTYTPNPNWHGTDTFTFAANDGTVESQPATVSITVTPVNDPPVATPQELTTPEDTPLDIVLAGTDVDVDPLTFTVATQPQNGTLAGTAQSPTYTPNPNWHGTDSFTFSVNDGTVESQPATVSITVTPVNDPPVATPQELTTPEDTPLDIVLAGTDVDVDPLTFTVATQPQNGTLAGTAQSPTYTPNPNWHGTDTFTFAVNDGTVESQPATVSITVTPVNDPPVATPQNLYTPEDTPLDIVLAGTDVDVDPLTFTVATQPQNGTLAGTAQSPTYTPNPNWHGTDTFTFAVNDGTVESQPATVSITVTPVNDPPVATPQNLYTPEDTPLDIVLAGTDVDVDPLTFTVATQPQNGTLAGTAQSPTYTPNPNWHGTDTFTFAVNDGTVESQPATVSITVTPVNDPPVATPQNLYTPEDTPLDIVLAGTDADGDGLTFAVVDSPTHGTLTGTIPGLTYTPNQHWSGTDTFTFTVNDGTVISQPATVSITVTPVNDPPIATPQDLYTPEDTPLGITLAGEDVDGDTLTFAVVDSPTHGTLTGTIPGLTYTPNQHWSGTDTFTFTVNDGTVISQPATVSITVTPVNDPPIATPQDLTTPEDTPVGITLAGADVDGDTLTFAVVDSPTHGTLTGTIPGLTYTPTQDWSGTDTFTFTVNDGTVASDPATVTITVTPVNDPPVATPQDLTTPEDTPVGVTLAGTDVDGNGLTFAVVDSPTHGTLTGTIPGLTYTPNQHWSGTDTFTFTVNDGTVISQPATVTITVTPVNDPPVATPQDLTTPEDTPLGIVLAGADVDGNTLTFAVVDSPTHGTLTGGAQSPTYTPKPNWHGTDTFTFTVNDGTVESQAATVTITVTPVNDPPVATPQELTTEEGTPLNILLAGADADGDTLTFTVATQPQNGTLTGTAPNLAYTPKQGWHDTDTFTFTAHDGTVASAPATVTITVTETPPEADPQELETPENTAVPIHLTGSYPPGVDPVFLVDVPPSHGTLSGTMPDLTYTPAEDWYGTDSFTFTVNGSAPATVTIRVGLTTEVYNGWNLVSTPYLGCVPAQLFANARNGGNCIVGDLYFYRDGDYETVGSDVEMVPGVGYWIYLRGIAPTGMIVLLDGAEPPPESKLVPLRTGWNLFGLFNIPGQELEAEKLPFASAPLAWSAKDLRYESQKKLALGVGYWARVADPAHVAAVDLPKTGDIVVDCVAGTLSLHLSGRFDQARIALRERGGAAMLAPTLLAPAREDDGWEGTLAVAGIAEDREYLLEILPSTCGFAGDLRTVAFRTTKPDHGETAARAVVLEDEDMAETRHTWEGGIFTATVPDCARRRIEFQADILRNGQFVFVAEHRDELDAQGQASLDLSGQPAGAVLCVSLRLLDDDDKPASSWRTFTVTRALE